MFSKHVNRDLSAYCHGELSAAKSRALAEHLIACARCRAEFDEIKRGVKLAEQLPRLSAPDSVWSELENVLSRQTSGSVSSTRRPSFTFWRPQFVALAAVVILTIALGFFLRSRSVARLSWEVARLDGAPRIGSSTIGNKGRLAVGEWLETDNTSRAKIEVGSIGQVEVDPNTRVRLVQTQPTEHRLELARGRMSARIWAPPRLFFVDTPSAVAADLGCAYTLEVDDQGSGLLHVTHGWVALQLKDRESMVPAGAACQTRIGVGPGTPYFEDASEGFRMALARLDFEREATSSSKTRTLEEILSEARLRDTLTLWHLLSRVGPEDRIALYERLAELAPPPSGVTRDGVLQLNEQMLQLWRNELDVTWSGSNPGALGKAWRRVWAGGLSKVHGLERKR